jgi:hypothetical protein
MKILAISLGGACLLVAACNRESEAQRIQNAVGNTLAPNGNVQQVAMTRGADNNYSGTATVRRADGRSVPYTCTARQDASAGQWQILCLQAIDQALLDELEANMRRSLEGQRVTVGEIEFTRRDDNNVTGFAQVTDPTTGETARLVCGGARPPNGGRIEVACNVPGGPASAAGAAPQAGEGQPAEPEEQAPAE